MQAPLKWGAKTHWKLIKAASNETDVAVVTVDGHISK